MSLASHKNVYISILWAMCMRAGNVITAMAKHLPQSHIGVQHLRTSQLHLICFVYDDVYTYVAATMNTYVDSQKYAY